jgi:hypothetical protein
MSSALSIQNIKLQAVVDRQEINELLMIWGQARDRAEWDILRDCFQPDGQINIAWISGSASEFVAKSSERLSEFKEGEYSKHVISPGRIQLNGRRAYSQCHVNHVTRVIVDGYEFDWEFWGQFHDLIEKREDNVWRLSNRTMVYEKDRLDPVHPGILPDDYFDDTDFSEFLPQVRFLGWRLKKNNIPPAKKLLTINSPEEATLIQNAITWLNKDF